MQYRSRILATRIPREKVTASQILDSRKIHSIAGRAVLYSTEVIKTQQCSVVCPEDTVFLLSNKSLHRWAGTEEGQSGRLDSLVDWPCWQNGQSGRMARLEEWSAW